MARAGSPGPRHPQCDPAVPGVHRLRRSLLGVVVLGVFAAVVGLVPTTPGAAAAEPVAVGPRIAEDEWRTMTDAYLEFATQSLQPGNAMSVIAHAERAERDPGFTWDPTIPKVADYASDWEKLDRFGDTGDFTINSLLHMYLVAGDQLDPALRQEIVDHLLSFKYWWTEPTPPGIVDDQYYWSENHLAIFLANEFVAGQEFPDEVFTNSGMTGEDHMAHARPRLLRWMALRAQYGFSEWLSNTYWVEDFMAMILLTDFAEDPDLAAYAQGILDIMFVELASHLQDGWFAATKGRTTNNDKKTFGRADSTYDIAELVFDDAPGGFGGVGRVVQLATSTGYRPPEVVRPIAADDTTHVVRQRQSFPIDPLGPVVPDQPAPYGLSYDDPMVWWPAGAWLSWPVAPLSVDLINTYDLFRTTNFQQAAALEPVVRDSPLPVLQDLAVSLAPAANGGLLSEVDTYTWRSPDAMLSTAQDFRPGQRAGQQHIWQATLDPQTSVFSGHPSGPTRGTDFTGDGPHWTDGAMPKAVQHQNVGISIYAPQYVSTPGSPIPFLEYEDTTHAYFPQERFDQVVQAEGWTLGRKGDSYVALWSWRDTEWSTDVLTDFTEPYELVAPGGPDNVWIVEVGTAEQWPGGFDDFVASVTAAPVSAVPLADGAPCPEGSVGCTHGIEDGFDVSYTSPTVGTMTSGWDSPLTVGGATVDVHGGKRMDTPWAQVGWRDMCYELAAGGFELGLDFTAIEPLVTDPDAELAPSSCGFVDPTTTTTTSTTTSTSTTSTSTTSTSTTSTSTTSTSTTSTTSTTEPLTPTTDDPATLPTSTVPGAPPGPGPSGPPTPTAGPATPISARPTFTG